MTLSSTCFLDILPSFDWKSFWSSLKVKPSRPLTAHERSQRFHFVTMDGKSPLHPDDLMGHAYVTPNNKVIYWLGVDEDAEAKQAYYLHKTPEQLFNAHGTATFDDVREEGDPISSEDRKQLLCDFYGDQKGLALVKTLG